MTKVQLSCFKMAAQLVPDLTLYLNKYTNVFLRDLEDVKAVGIQIGSRIGMKECYAMR